MELSGDQLFARPGLSANQHSGICACHRTYLVEHPQHLRAAGQHVREAVLVQDLLPHLFELALRASFLEGSVGSLDHWLLLNGTGQVVGSTMTYRIHRL